MAKDETERDTVGDPVREYRTEELAAAAATQCPPARRAAPPVGHLVKVFATNGDGVRALCDVLGPP